MANTSVENTIRPVEKDYSDYTQRGDDFLKIGLLRHAKNWYKKALELHIESEKIMQKIGECDKELAFERKVVFILVAVAVAIICLYILI
jgi:hypothetical protein